MRIKFTPPLASVPTRPFRPLSTGTKTIRSLVHAGIIGSIALLACTSAQAQLPDATFLLQVGTDQVLAPGTLTYPTASATITQGLDPYVAASSSAAGLAEANLSYYFEIGGSGQANVTITANGAASANDANGEGMDDFVVFNFPSHGVVISAGGTSSNSFALDQSIALYTGVVYGVAVTAEASDESSAWVDPQISLDAGQAGDSLTFSPNFLPSSVPDGGAAFGLLGMGLAALAAFRRKLS